MIRPGIDIGYLYKSMNMDGITTGMNPQTGQSYSNYTGTLTKNALDIGAGAVFITKHVYGGIAVHHLNEPDEGLIGKSKLPMKYTAHLAGIIGHPDSARMFSVSPHVLLVKQQDFQQLVAGVTAKYDKYLIGVAYRNGDSYILQAGFQNSHFRIGYSYDHTVSNLSGATAGSHEVTVSMNILYNQGKKIDPFNPVAF